MKQSKPVLTAAVFAVVAIATIGNLSAQNLNPLESEPQSSGGTLGGCGEPLPFMIQTFTADELPPTSSCLSGGSTSYTWTSIPVPSGGPWRVVIISAGSGVEGSSPLWTISNSAEECQGVYAVTGGDWGDHSSALPFGDWLIVGDVLHVKVGTQLGTPGTFNENAFLWLRWER